MLAAMLMAFMVAGVPGYYNTYVVNPISGTEILPTTSINATPSNIIKLHACRNQYQSASFVIRAEKNLKSFWAMPGNLSDGTNTIPASAVDIRVVKCWYQSGPRDIIIRQPGRYLTPELLLKNDGLVRVDTIAQHNYLRLRGGGEICISDETQATPELIQPTDTFTLQPLSISADTNKQFWITLHVPNDAVPGTYKGRIFLTADGIPPHYIDLELLVHPFTLEQPNLIYGLVYYAATHTDFPNGTIGHGWKSVQQYTAEMTDMAQHGIYYPWFACYPKNPKVGFDTDLNIREAAGLPKDFIQPYAGVPGPPAPQTKAELDAYRAFIRSIKARVESHGYAKMYCSGIDEGQAKILPTEFPAFEAIHEEGCYVWIGTNVDNKPFEIVGKYVDVANYAWAPNKKEAAKWHSVGAKIFNYANPQTANENPYTYRRNYGWLLFVNNYDGCQTCAYQGNIQGQHIWNDFAGIPIKGYRGHNLTYPTTNGVIDTIQYEGFREGINDMRYLATLQGAIRDYAKSKPALATAAQAWINSVSPNDNLDAVRLKMVDWINQLRG
jgi:hypothetical protein